MLSNKLTFLIALVLALSAVALGEPKTVTVQSESRFCLLMPKSGDYRPISYCTEPIDAIPYTKVTRLALSDRSTIANGPIVYVQVTGRALKAPCMSSATLITSRTVVPTGWGEDAALRPILGL
ncbi:MAG: hypothetical protein J3Q66DRAFT_389286 [Benniella sp.]|nr:MAG: hypothetical protein J3Q66DRAFT_389286 [Benniella sp.]